MGNLKSSNKEYMSGSAYNIRKNHINIQPLALDIKVV